jgi:hypothetical protein
MRLADSTNTFNTSNDYNIKTLTMTCLGIDIHLTGFMNLKRNEIVFWKVGEVSSIGINQLHHISRILYLSW